MLIGKLMGGFHIYPYSKEFLQKYRCIFNQIVKILSFKKKLQKYGSGICNHIYNS